MQHLQYHKFTLHVCQLPPFTQGPTPPRPMPPSTRRCVTAQPLSHKPYMKMPALLGGGGGKPPAGGDYPFPLLR